MARMHWFELEDQPWWPRPWREMMTDYLRTAAEVALPYDILLPLMHRGLEPLDSHRIVDLCAGAGGAPLALQSVLAKDGLDVEVIATDLFPNVPAFERLGVPHVKEPVDATCVPEELSGMRTVFNALHHFRPELIRQMFEDATAKRQSFLGIEVVQRSVPALVAMVPTPLFVMALTPIMRPFRWDRFLWTYLLPVVPVATWFDGTMSCLRSYTKGELEGLTDGLRGDGYTWEVGSVKVPWTPASLTYVLGHPEG
jgi:hypothetical protein